MVCRLGQLVKNTHTAAGQSGSREHRRAEILLRDDLGTRERKQDSPRTNLFKTLLHSACGSPGERYAEHPCVLQKREGPK